MVEENTKLIIKLESSRMSCAGAVAAYLLRRLSSRAGTYAPGIQEHLFQAIGQNANGSTLDKVELWLRNNAPTLAALGYQVLHRRVAVETEPIKQWVEDGKGYRGVVLATDGSKLHGNGEISSVHAVGLTVNDATAGIDDDSLSGSVVMIDPWPGVTQFTAPPSTLEPARRFYKYTALLMFWSGYG